MRFFCGDHKYVAPNGSYHTETTNFIYIVNRLTGSYKSFLLKDISEQTLVLLL